MIEDRENDARNYPRTSIFLAAALYCDGASSPVKIRNISTSGALVEGSSLPDAGALVQLVRGGLIVHGLVSWSTGARCGLKFSGCIDVQCWRASPSNAEQQRVDEIVRLVKAGAVPLAVPQLEPMSASSAEGDAQPGADLERAIQLLERLGETLAEDPDVTSRNGTALQNLDIAIQVITAAKSAIAGDRDSDGDAMRLSGLRRSADQALSRSA